MTSRERKNSTSNAAPLDVTESNIRESGSAASAMGRRAKRRALKPKELRRRQLFETLEQRQLLAGPQLIGVQPNEGELIVEGTVRDTAPRSLTFRFDETQQIDPNTLNAIQFTRSGVDGQFGTSDDVSIQPGSISLGALTDNEVVVRFADSLPDDRYRINVFGFDAPTRGIVGLRNLQGELLVARDGVGDVEHVDFELRLGARIEAVVPQPVVRLSDRTLEQRRDEILVYFNDDELFVENDPATGLPTERSAEHPRFYQLLLTEETVRTTDDAFYQPERVIYDAATNTARLIFADDINQLPGVSLGGGTFRLRIGTAVDQAQDLIIKPTELEVVPRVSSNLGAAADLEVEFVSKVFGEAVGNRKVSFSDSGAGGLSVRIDAGTQDIIFDFGGSPVTVAQLRDVARNTPSVDAVLAITFAVDGVPGTGGSLVIPASLAGSEPLQMVAAGDMLTSATDIGVFGTQGSQLLSSLLISESIDPQSYQVQLPGATTDPGRSSVGVGLDGPLARAINERFGADSTDGITEIEYNFRGIFAGGVGTGIPAQLNNITDVQKRRVREAVSLWSAYLGIQFRETKDAGITFALGTPSELTAAPETEIREVSVLDADLRIDPTFAESAMVFSNEAPFDLNYGEDFFRKTMTGIGFLLGLEQNDDVTAQTLMALDPSFLNATIDPTPFVSPIDPFTSLQTTRLQSINSQLDSQTIGDPLPNALTGEEPIFPGRQDILHGQLLHRPDSVDVDLFRFEVSLDAGREFGTLTVESFAERLADSSLLDTSLTLFEDVSASATTDFGLGSDVLVRIDSQLPGNMGDRSRLEFILTDRNVGDDDVRVDRVVAANGNLVANAIRVDIPRLRTGVTEVTVGQVIDAVNSDAFGSTLFQLSLIQGDLGANLISSPLGSYSPIRLSDGGTVPLTHNDDYFSSDSLLTAKLQNGVYYIGVAASGNDNYDPSIANSGFGGRTQGDYELLVKFEPQVSQSDVLRDLDSDRIGVPGTAIDGDLDGKPSGVNNFWFQTRPLERILQVVSDGSGIVAGQSLTVTGADGANRRFEFVPIGGSARPGSVKVEFSPLNTIADIAVNLATAISNNSGALNVTAIPQVDLGNPLAPAQLILTGERSLEFSANSQGINALGRTLFVDKVASVVSDGSLSQPFNNIAGVTQASAFDAALPGDIVRIVGNGGQDNDIATADDNFAYQVGLTEIGGRILADGRHLDVPKGVTTMIDAGAAFKMRSSTVSVGSNNLLSDRSEGALQVLGTPRLLQVSAPSALGAGTLDTGIVDLGASGNVVFTSTRDRAVDAAASGNSPAPSEGNWGGLIFRSDFDRREGRLNLEDEGIFLQIVNHADIRFGGGSNILINSVQQTVNPIQMVDLRPTVTFNRLANNASAAMSASPDAFLETRFQEPRFQQAGAFTADYSRIGPNIRQNLIVNNSINGLFIRTITDRGQTARQITVAAHIDDVDIVHYVAENIVIAGQPGGPIQDGFLPDASTIALQTSGGGSLAVGDYQYRMTFLDRSGFESLPSAATGVVTTIATARKVQLLNLPVIPDQSDYLTRRLYRLDPVDGLYRLVADLNRSAATFVDDGSTAGGAVLDLNRTGVRGRLNGSLVIDPNSVVKFRGARIELDHGTQLLAEGLQGQPVVFTSALDDRFGAGGSFDTNEDAGTPGGGTLPQRGDWSGIYAGPTANVSFDNAIIAYGGGVSLIEGGQSRGFSALELQQATGRITNTRFEYNDNAQDGSGPVGRNGRLANTPATIYGRFTQPIIADNQFTDNYGAIIDLDLASLTDDLLVDTGRQTGAIDLLVGLDDNRGPLIRRNTTDSIPGDVDGQRQLNGLRIRGGELTGGSVWDDTDISHVLYESVVVGNLVSGTGLTLKSRPDESLVVKFAGRGTPNSATAGTGITATGSRGDISDRIGGSVYIVGLPGAPVVLTSLKDDSVGAGRRPDGTAQTDTNGDGFGSRPAANDWRSLLFDGLSNDRNVAVVQELELSTTAPPGLNSTVQNAQILGDLAERLTASDDQQRLGFQVDGFITGPGDIDTYAFTAAAGTQVWIDVDRTSLGLDSVIEVVDDSGDVIARSDNSFAEVDAPSQIDILDSEILAGALGDGDDFRTERWENGNYYDVGSTNLRDAGIRITLPGVVGTRSDYFIRVRGASVDPDDVNGGTSDGAYQLQLRLREDQEFPGSVVRHADIRYANNGIHVQGLPGSSPLIGEAQENESADPFSAADRLATGDFLLAGGYNFDDGPRYGTDLYASNDRIDGGFFGGQGPFQTQVLNSRPQNLGDLVDSKTGTISVGGELSDVSDVDFYQLDIDRDGSLTNALRSTIFDIDYAAGFDRPDTNISVFYSATGSPNAAKLVLFGESSNILDDLSSPIETDLIGELLQRGSISENDPLIGPVALPTGSYFIAITESGRTPLELTTNPRLRRSPIDSGVRIFDDHIDVIGGATAEPPREREFVDSTTSGWSVTNNRATDPGHQRQGPIGFQAPQGGASADSTPAGSGSPAVDDGLQFQTRGSTSTPIDIGDAPPVPVASSTLGANGNPSTRLLNLGGYLSGPSDDAPLDIALSFLNLNSTNLGLVASDLDDVLVTDQYVSESTGVTHLYLRQTYGELEVIGADININITADGEVINVGSSFVAQLGITGLPEPDLTAIEALDSLATELNWILDLDVEVLDPAQGFNQMTTLAPSGVSLDPIPAELAYVATGVGVELVWNLIVAPLDGENWYDASVSATDGELLNLDDWVADAAYNVFALPLENPQDGNRTLVVDPQNLVASPFGWHDTDGAAGAEFTDTRGNNVSAQEDTNADNAGGFRPDGGAALVFDFPLNLPADPATYQAAAITNLFYINNVVHDVLYQYGFDEASGNFQENNYGNGGLGNDSVQADAQDGSGVNNANFATPPDGINPRMQQFVFTLTNPSRDSDLSNSIIVHEYGHGITNRLTGGAANSGALQAVQSRGMGEGWSDFYSLMFTQKTTDAQADAYPVGNWVLGQSPAGGGIRSFPYSYDMTINPLTYGVGNARFPVGSPHAEGEIWASALWDMNWLLINGDLGGPNPFSGLGFDPDLYNGTSGNNVALQLVTDGLKLQPANPSFLDARDAILLADQLNYGGANFVAIWTAFARRGMGFSADDGGSGNSTVVFEAFDLPPFPDPNNASIHFDRSEAMGTLTSTSFDLTGYSAADLPRFYFDYFVDAAAGDTIDIQAWSNEQPTPTGVGIDLNNASNFRSWRQAIASLEQFAGDTGVTIEFTYDTDLASTTGEGLYLDNFVVGFAERGESISGASAGNADFTATATGTPGRYQLEIRPATEYTTPLNDGVLIERLRADDPKLLDPIWMTIPSGRGIVRYESFTIDVLNTVTGLDETLTFQFQPTEASLQDPSLVDPLAIPVTYSRADTSLQIVGSLAATIRGLDDYAFFNVRPSAAQLVESFDTNDRQAEQTTLVAPAANQISDGDRFTLSDGSRTVTFEFSTDSTVTFGNIRVPYTAGDSSAVIARRMIEVINSGTVQGNLKLRASAVSGEWDFNNPTNPEAAPTDARVAIHGTVVGNFDAVAGVADAPGTPLPLADDGSLILPAIFHDGVGDQNTVRTQGQIIVENNQITEVRAVGIWSDPGRRGTDPEDLRNETVDPLSAGTNFIQMPPVGNSQLGGVINFPELNDSVEGGLAPGLVIQNNIVDQAGYTGIKIDGETRPLVIEWNQLFFVYTSGTTILSSRGDIMVPDGFIFAIDAGSTRVVFEFEDISGAPVNLGGSGVAGGDGFVDGHVPVYYRLGEGPTYNPSRPDPVRNVGHTVHEIMMSVYESIQGSILVSNGLLELVRPTLGPSLTSVGAPLQQMIDQVPLLRPQILDPDYLDFFTPAIYLEGATAIYSSQAFQKQVGSGRTTMLSLNRGIGDPFNLDTEVDFFSGIATNPSAPLMPIAEAPQPLAKVINNTVRGSDGTEGAYLEDGSLSPAVEMPTEVPNDTIAEASDTKLEVSHRGGYFADAIIGDNTSFLTADQDVDFFQVELSVGDRLIVDIDTIDFVDDNGTPNNPFDDFNVSGPETKLRVFDSSGTEVVVGQNGLLPDYLKPGSTVEFPVSDTSVLLPDGSTPRDGFIDFTALKKDTYYVGVSSAGNENYEAKSLTERTEGTGGTGDYGLAIEVLAPRSFVFSLDSHPLDPFGAEVLSGNINGTLAEGGPAGARSLVGTTFTISQIPDYLIPTRRGDAYAGVNADGNRVTFEYTPGINRIVLANGNINVPILTNDFLSGGGHRVPDIMRATSNAINGYLNNPALPNHEVGNGPDGRDGPVTRVHAQALGGANGDNIGIENMIRTNGALDDTGSYPFGIFGSIDFTTGFGHDRREGGGSNIVPNGTFTDSRGTTELYVLIENAAKIELSPEARAAGLKLGPDNSRDVNGDLRNAGFATESDQLLAEQGIFIGSGASAAILNNVVVNVHQSMVQEESSVLGFGGRINDVNPDLSVKKGNVVAAGNAFQYDDFRNTQMRSDVSWWVGFGGFVNGNPALDGSLSTDLRTGPTNISGGNSDFNFVVQQPGTPGQTPGNFITFLGDDLLEDGAGGRFTPGPNAAIIDSAVDSIDPNVSLATLNSLLGIPTRTINAPDRDFSGQLRADEPTMAPPGGIGANVFKDRGALDRADFVGPNARLEFPLDNDFAGSDLDPASSFVIRDHGVFTEFRILVQDLGDDSNPFVGSGIDDDTLVVSPIPGLRKPGSNLTLFENERVLTEGIDYTFSYDETRGVITLKPLAGVWKSDRSYRMQLNNRDRTVLIAPDPTAISDGDQLSVIDSTGGTLIFEFESGYLIQMPEAIALEVPREGTNLGGLFDGGIFSIGDGANLDVVFEFDSNGSTVPGSVPVLLPSTVTPIDEGLRQEYLEAIAKNIEQAIQSVIDDPTVSLDLSVRTSGTSVIISSEPNTRVDLSTSGLNAAARTLGLQVPNTGADVGGVVAGETFEINDSRITQGFEFVGLLNPQPATGFIGVDISPVNGTPLNADEVAAAILASIDSSTLNLTPEILGRIVYLDLPTEGAATVAGGKLRAVSVSRTPEDGGLIEFTPNDGGAPVVFEINRTDERDAVNGIIDDGVDPANIAINITRDQTGDELADTVARAIVAATQSQPIAGLDETGVMATGSGLLRIGGQDGLGLTVAGSSMEVTGDPGVTGASTLEVFGPLLLEVSATAPIDGDFFAIFDGNGNPVTFEFDSNNLLSNPTAVRVVFSRFDDQDAVSNAVVSSINSQSLGLTAVYLGGGEISLGRVDLSRVDTLTSSMTTRRGIVSDGEVITITQGSISVSYEFESISNGGGVSGQNFPVPFQPGSSTLDVANSLAAAIASNSGGLDLSPAVTAEGLVALNDVPGTVVDVSTASSIILSGVPGGATAVNFSPADTASDINLALLKAINSVGFGSTLLASDRGGATLFVENGRLFEGPLESFYLPAIKDLSGNPLVPNRDDNTTQFTLLLPTVELDFGDAPDPSDLVSGRYASLLGNDGARHVVTPDLTLGTRVDGEPDAQVTGGADGDDLVISIASDGSLFNTSVGDGFAEIQLQAGVDPTTRDGDTVTLTLADRTVTIEFDIDGIFEEANFAIAPIDPSSTASITLAIEAAIAESGLRPSEVKIEGNRVLVYSDDEDGVSFVSDINPNGNFSKGLITPISVTVTGAGVLQAWIDFNGDGDWVDPGELVIDGITQDTIFSEPGQTITRIYNVTVPAFASPPSTAINTYARFRISREGGLDPNGLALSGEVEDYQVVLVPGSAPTVTPPLDTRSYTVQEENALLVLDQDGLGSVSPDDNGLLLGIVDADNDPIAIFSGDVGVRPLFTDLGEEAGELDLSADGTFTFLPKVDFNGIVRFEARVTDVKPLAPGTELVNPIPMKVTIEVLPVNDKPFSTVPNVITNVTIDEDVVTIFAAEDLIDPFYLAGPGNELSQLLVFQSVSSVNLGDSVSMLGGILEISPDGRSVRYTPPVDYNGATPDVFNFVVADVPGTGQIAESADKPGTVSITIDSVNDAPIAGGDFYNAMEDTNLSIAIHGGGSIVGILDNDVPGPQNEIDPPESQTIDLPLNQFPVQTTRGGSVRVLNGALVYTPPGLYSGPDGFTYQIVDSLGAQSTGTVAIDVGGENDAPRFEGVDGEKDNLGQAVTTIVLPESKPNAQSTVYDLDTWFSDPENDALTYTVTSSNESIVSVNLDARTLTLTRPAYAFGTVSLTIDATDTGSLNARQIVTVSILNENDPPLVIGTLDPLSGDEDQTVVRELSSVFSDPDGDTLTYVVLKLDSIIRPTPAQIAAHPLIASIELPSIQNPGNQIRITPKPNQFGEVDIEIEATDGSFNVSDTFTLTINSVPDAPVAVDDGYNVSVGSTLQVLNPANGLLRNDFDADGDPISVDLNSVSQPTRGTLQVNADGTFVYVSNSGNVGDVDTFSYRIVDNPPVGASRFSELRTVTLTLNQSRYQNPVAGMESDVTADGFVSPIDALRVINFLARRAPLSGAVPVSEIGSAPPDFYDVDGNGFVNPSDALRVINALALNASNGEGEMVTESNLMASSVSFASASSAFLPTTNPVAVTSTDQTQSAVMSITESTDALLTAGLQIESKSPQSVGDDLVGSTAGAENKDAVDDVLTGLIDDWGVSLEF